MSEILDESHFFSKERALRGAKNGAKFGAGLIGTGIFLTAILSPDEFVQSYQHLLEIGVRYTALQAAMGAVIDGFRPTSKAVQRHIDNLLSVKNGLANFYHYITEQGYKELPEKMVRIIKPEIDPELLHHKRLISTYLGLCAGAGAVAGGAVWGTISLMNLTERTLDKLPFVTPSSSNYFSPLQFIADNPVGVIAIGAVLGIGISAYVMTHDSQLNPNS